MEQVHQFVSFLFAQDIVSGIFPTVEWQTVNLWVEPKKFIDENAETLIYMLVFFFGLKTISGYILYEFGYAAYLSNDAYATSQKKWQKE